MNTTATISIPAASMPSIVPPSPAWADDASPNFDGVHTVLYAKRATIMRLFDLGTTLLRELHTPGSANFDPSFPQPFRLTENGPSYFDVFAVIAWVKTRQAIAAHKAAGKSR